MKLVLVFLFLSQIIFGQTDWYRWEKAETNYEIPLINESNNHDDSSFGSSVLSGLQKSYSFLISDLDGDNCPFHPTCSAFYIHSIKETNFFQGTLMFADRFTRDSNLFKRKDHYPRYISGKFYDPTHNYFLIQGKVKYYSRHKIVE